MGSRREAIAKTKGEIDDLIRYLDKCSELVTPRRGVYKMLHFSRYDLRKAMESFRKKASNLTELQALTGLFEDKIERPLKETLEEEMHAMHAMHAVHATALTATGGAGGSAGAGAGAGTSARKTAKTKAPPEGPGTSATKSKKRKPETKRGADEEASAYSMLANAKEDEQTTMAVRVFPSMSPLEVDANKQKFKCGPLGFAENPVTLIVELTRHDETRQIELFSAPHDVYSSIQRRNVERIKGCMLKMGLSLDEDSGGLYAEPEQAEERDGTDVSRRVGCLKLEFKGKNVSLCKLIFDVEFLDRLFDSRDE